MIALATDGVTLFEEEIQLSNKGGELRAFAAQQGRGRFSRGRFDCRATHRAVRLRGEPVVDTLRYKPCRDTHTHVIPKRNSNDGTESM